ncbi:MAG TPA: hypothetical protein VMS31_18355 [Pyrinomonadaceae bacterium]|nr:hypothetical protein [Pyrinomonadaceae bacterium]
MFSYFVPGLLVLAAGDDAGVALVAGLGVITGALTVALGERDPAAGLAAGGVVESLTGSLLHADANPIETIARSKRAPRLMTFIFRVLIAYSSFEQD